MRINEVLKRKTLDGVVTISPDATVRELIGLLAEHNVGALIVSTDGSSVDGIVSERDVVRRLRDGAELLDGAVHSIMTSEVHTCELDHDLDSLMSLMTERRIRHLPVVENGALRGLGSIGDVVKGRLSELEAETQHLTDYISSGR